MCRRVKWLVLLPLLLAPLLAAALEDDYRQTIYVQADQVEIDNHQGISTYQGHVVVDQGSLHLEASRLVVTRQGKTLQHIEAEGAPASFRQRPTGADADIEGSATHMVYRTADDLMVLDGAATIRKGGDLFSGDHIEYNTRSSVVSASGEANGSGRVHAIIQPQPESTAPTGPPEETK